MVCCTFCLFDTILFWVLPLAPVYIHNFRHSYDSIIIFQITTFRSRHLMVYGTRACARVYRNIRASKHKHKNNLIKRQSSNGTRKETTTKTTKNGNSSITFYGIQFSVEDFMGDSYLAMQRNECQKNMQTS